MAKLETGSVACSGLSHRISLSVQSAPAELKRQLSEVEDEVSLQGLAVGIWGLGFRTQGRSSVLCLCCTQASSAVAIDAIAVSIAGTAMCGRGC